MEFRSVAYLQHGHIITAVVTNIINNTCQHTDMRGAVRPLKSLQLVKNRISIVGLVYDFLCIAIWLVFFIALITIVRIIIILH